MILTYKGGPIRYKLSVENWSAHSWFGLERINMIAPAWILVSISELSRHSNDYCDEVLLILGAQGLAQNFERSYVGVLADFDFRKWTVERVEGEVARILKMMETVYNQVGWVPTERLNFHNTLKPLIDLDGDLAWQRNVVTVRMLIYN